MQGELDETLLVARDPGALHKWRVNVRYSTDTIRSMTRDTMRITMKHFLTSQPKLLVGIGHECRKLRALGFLRSQLELSRNELLGHDVIRNIDTFAVLLKGKIGRLDGWSHPSVEWLADGFKEDLGTCRIV